MKKIALISLVFVIISSCNNEDMLKVDNSWNLVKVTGGFAGIDENFDKGEIKWTFNEGNSTLKVVKNTTEPYSGIAEGTYLYSILSNSDHFYLIIDSQEKGGIITTGSFMEVDENKQSTGAGADGFIYHFEK
tara:strand:+ start:95721 stop:96116 length:396 start_codon:yes stop_codon:yes gene_type:complete